MRHRENSYKVAQCILYDECIRRKFGRTLWNVYIITCASQGKLVLGCRVYISSRVHHKLLKCIYHDVSITERVVVKLERVSIITCASQGKL